MSNLGNKKIMGENISFYMRKAGIDRGKLASDLKISYSTISDWINGKTYPRIDKIEMMSDYFGVSKADLVENGKAVNNIIEFSREEKLYPLIDAAIPAGMIADVGTFTQEDIENGESISLPESIMGKYSSNTDIFVTHVNGESMNNVIPDKSLIAVKLIESAFDLENGDIVVFRNGSGLSIKRFYNDTIEKRLVFRPDSNDKSFIDQVVNYDEAEDLQIYGKVVVYVVNL